MKYLVLWEQIQYFPDVYFAMVKQKILMLCELYGYFFYKIMGHMRVVPTDQHKYVASFPIWRHNFNQNINLEYSNS